MASPKKILELVDTGAEGELKQKKVLNQEYLKNREEEPLLTTIKKEEEESSLPAIDVHRPLLSYEPADFQILTYPNPQVKLKKEHFKLGSRIK